MNRTVSNTYIYHPDKPQMHKKGLCIMKNKGVIEDIFPQSVHILLRIVKLNNGSTATFLQY